MQNANEIRHHMQAVGQTRKITNAMYLIATARIKKAMQRIEYNNIYFSRVRASLKDILLSPHPVTHPYLNKKEDGKRLYIVAAGDKGMAGSYNSAVLEYAYKELMTRQAYGSDFELYTIGIVAGQFFKRKGLKPTREIMGISQNPTISDANKLVIDILDRFDHGDVRSVYMIYTQFIYGAQGGPVMRRILPIRVNDYSDVKPTEKAHDIYYFPSHDEVFRLLIPRYLVGLLYGSLVQSYASEHLSRMNAMQSATQNADELLKKLHLEYNLARQSAITREITEIASAAEIIGGADDPYAAPQTTKQGGR